MNATLLYDLCVRFANSPKNLDSYNYNSLHLLSPFMYPVPSSTLLLFHFRDAMRLREWTKLLKIS